MRDTVRRILVSMVVAGCLVGIGLAISAGGSKPSSTAPLPAAVEQVLPPPGDLDLRQVQIGADLAPGYTGVLIVDGKEVPEPDLHREPALYSVVLQPQPDSDFKDIGPGSHRVTVLFWKLDETRADAHSYTWAFKLH